MTGKIIKQCIGRYCFSCHEENYSANLSDFIKTISTQMRRAQPLKTGRSATLVLSQIGDQAVVVKRYNLKNFNKRLKRIFSPGRALNSWRFANLLLAHELLTPTPIAFVERRVLGLRGKTYYISEYIEGINPRDFLLSDTVDSSLYNQMIASLVKLIVEMGRLNICHGDLKATNFLIADAKVYLTDLDSMKIYKNKFQLYFNKDIQRFFNNWEVDSIPYKKLLAAFSNYDDVFVQQALASIR